MDPWEETPAAIKKVLAEKEENLATPMVEIYTRIQSVFQHIGPTLTQHH